MDNQYIYIDFNFFLDQLLLSDYEDIGSDDSNPLHPRVRRDDEKSRCHHHHRHKFCCGDDVMHSLYEQYQPIKKECYKEVTGKELKRGGPPPFTCEELEEAKKNMFVSMTIKVIHHLI